LFTIQTEGGENPVTGLRIWCLLVPSKHEFR
jgi:hypothetical protein